MSDDLDRLRADWAAQTLQHPRFTEADLAKKASELDRAVRSRNRVEYAAAAFVAVAFTIVAVVAKHPLSQVGSAWIAASAVYIAWVLRSRGSVGAPDWTADGRSWLVTELTREHALLSGVWRWYLGPMVPGLALFFAGPALAADSALELATVGAGVVVGGAVFAWIGRLNLRAADAIADALAELRTP